MNATLQTVLTRINTWAGEHVFTPEMVYQCAVILACFVAGGAIYKLLSRRVTSMIDGSGLPLRVKRILGNLKRLIFSVFTLGFMFAAAAASSTEFFTHDITFMIAVMKVLLAWILIRIALQFVENPVVRNFFALIIWGIAALSIFGVLEETKTALDLFGFSIGKFRLSALVIIKTILSVFILMYLAIFVSTFAERRVLRTKGMSRSSQVLIAKIIRIVLISCALLAGVASAGVDLSIFAVFSGAVGLGVGFGLQKVVSNLFSGMLLLMDKSIQPGDVIELESSQTFGWVHHMGARFTEIITRDNKSFLIPNEDFITQRVINWSHGDKLIRLDIKFSTAYSSDPRQVMDLAKQAALVPQRVASSPAPVCWLVEFGDNGLVFSLRFWIRDAESGITNVKGEIMLALWDAFNANGIEIPYPRREIFINNAKAPVNS